MSPPGNEQFVIPQAPKRQGIHTALFTRLLSAPASTLTSTADRDGKWSYSLIGNLVKRNFYANL